jgi:hypothetical protein
MAALAVVTVAALIAAVIPVVSHSLSSVAHPLKGGLGMRG